MVPSRVKWRISRNGILLIAAILAMSLSALPASAAVSGAAKAPVPVSSPVRAAGAGPTVAPDIFNGGYYFDNGNTGLCIDDSSDFGLRAYTCNGPSYESGYQKWLTGYF
jgi:hypothetical protein